MQQAVDFEFHQFNEECRKDSHKPFPLEKVTIQIQDKEHFNQSIALWRNALDKWWEKQDN